MRERDPSPAAREPNSLEDAQCVEQRSFKGSNNMDSKKRGAPPHDLPDTPPPKKPRLQDHDSQLKKRKTPPWRLPASEEHDNKKDDEAEVMADPAEDTVAPPVTMQIRPSKTLKPTRVIILNREERRRRKLAVRRTRADRPTNESSVLTAIASVDPVFRNGVPITSSKSAGPLINFPPRRLHYTETGQLLQPALNYLKHDTDLDSAPIRQRKEIYDDLICRGVEGRNFTSLRRAEALLERLEKDFGLKVGYEGVPSRALMTPKDAARIRRMKKILGCPYRLSPLESSKINNEFVYGGEGSRKWIMGALQKEKTNLRFCTHAICQKSHMLASALLPGMEKGATTLAAETVFYGGYQPVTSLYEKATISETDDDLEADSKQLSYAPDIPESEISDSEEEEVLADAEVPLADHDNEITSYGIGDIDPEFRDFYF